MTANPILRFRNALDQHGIKHTSNGSGIRFPCPAHGGERDSGIASVGDSGKLILHCHSKNCTAEEICRAVGMSPAEMFPDDFQPAGRRSKPREVNRNGQPVKVYETREDAAWALAYGLQKDAEEKGWPFRQRKPDREFEYHDSDGRCVFVVCRWDTPGRANGCTKEIRQISAFDGGWITKAFDGQRPLYRLPMIQAAESETVFVCEGEKAADALESIGLLATTPSQGAQSPNKTDWRPLNGRHVVILPDRDLPGESFAANVVALLKDQAPDARVEIRELRDDWPEIPEGGDSFDWIHEHRTVERDELVRRLHSLPNQISKFNTPPGPDDKPGGRQEGAETPLVFHDAWEAAFKPRPMRECIIEGLLRRGEVGNVIASTKTGKSWFGLLLLICIATGREWLGRRVARGNVLLIDNELHTEVIENRIAAVRDRLDIRHETPRERFEYVACRGDWISLQDMIAAVPEKHLPGSLNLIVIDAKYRLFGNGLEENSNDDQTKFHNLVDQFAKKMNCPILLIHHATKGDQSGKSVTDVGSGGGSQSRAVDLHMTIRPHQQPEMAVLEAAVRSFAPVEPVTLRWNWPIWTLDSAVEPVVRQKTTADSRQEVKDQQALEQLTGIIRTSEYPLTRSALRRETGFNADKLNRLLRLGEDKGLIVRAGTVKAHNGLDADLFKLSPVDSAET